METPLVTVFLPVFNAENYVRDSLESILNQTYSNLEIIIVDDGSTDSSVEIINSYMDNRIRLIVNEENMGIPYTRNIALKEANGKYLVNMDSDDIAHLDRIEKQVHFMEKNSNIDVVGSYYITFGENKEKSIKSKVILPQEIKASLIFTNPIGNPTTLIRLQTLKKFKILYNKEYFVAQDYDMWIQISKIGNLAILPEILLKYRKGHLNITKNTKSNKAFDRKKIIDSIHIDILNFYRFNLSDDEIKTFNNFYSENPQSYINEDTINDIPNVILKIIEQNKINKSFNEEVLESVVRLVSLNILSNLKISFIKKIVTYLKVNQFKGLFFRIKDLSYLLLKHIYFLLRKT